MTKWNGRASNKQTHFPSKIVRNSLFVPDIMALNWLTIESVVCVGWNRVFKIHRNAFIKGHF